jgi:hypothetical protein
VHVQSHQAVLLVSARKLEDLLDGLVGFASHTYDPVQWCGHQPTSAAKRVPVPSVMLCHVMVHSVTSRKV